MNVPKERLRAVLKKLLLYLALISGGTLAGIAGTLYISDWISDYQAKQASDERAEHALGPGVPPTPDNFYPTQAVDRMPVVRGFEVLADKDAERAVHDNEFVLAVEIDGAARAYPLNVLTDPSREIFNDELGGRAIAATW